MLIRAGVLGELGSPSRMSGLWYLLVFFGPFGIKEIKDVLMVSQLLIMLLKLSVC